MVNFLYQPNEFSWDPSIVEYVTAVYSDLNRDDCNPVFMLLLKDKITTLHFLFKQAGVNGNLPLVKVKELQDYFWRLYYDRFDACGRTY